MSPRKVFISHTSEFTEYPREKSFITVVIDAAIRAKCVVCDMRYFTARDVEPALYCKERVRECDIYVGIIGFRYGSPVRDRPEISYTELEFEAASEKPTMNRLIFLLSPEAELPLGLFADASNAERQKLFRQRLHDSGRVCGSFTNVHRLETLIYQALIEDIVETKRWEVEPTAIKRTDEREDETSGDMVKILKGSYHYGEKKTRVDISYDYWIDKFPVTNDKYREFILQDGYNLNKYWSIEGWEWRTENNIWCPKYWNEKMWNEAELPVVGVSYYEAEAYAKWAGKRLPTEKEWEKAGRGVEGRKFPWGNYFVKDHCNSKELGLSVPTPVTKFLAGVSPYGCYDMAGNVWEWCDGWYAAEDEFKVIRGGSWANTADSLVLWNRGGFHPGDQCNNLGFRLVQDHTELPK